MRKSRFTDEQMVAILRKADRDPIAGVAKKHGISEQTIYSWRKRFGALQSDDIRRLWWFLLIRVRTRQLNAEQSMLSSVFQQAQLARTIREMDGLKSMDRLALGQILRCDQDAEL